MTLLPCSVVYSLDHDKLKDAELDQYTIALVGVGMGVSGVGVSGVGGRLVGARGGWGLGWWGGDGCVVGWGRGCVVWWGWGWGPGKDCCVLGVCH